MGGGGREGRKGFRFVYSSGRKLPLREENLRMIYSYVLVVK
jgi:hypothetical protein